MSATTYFDEEITRKVLDFKYTGGNTIDAVLDAYTTGAITITDSEGNKLEKDPIPLKNVCAKLTPELSDKIDNTANILGIPKRRFIELAMINAIGHVESLLEKYEAFEYRYEGMGEGKEGEQE